MTYLPPHGVLPNGLSADGLGAPSGTPFQPGLASAAAVGGYESGYPAGYPAGYLATKPAGYPAGYRVPGYTVYPGHQAGQLPHHSVTYGPPVPSDLPSAVQRMRMPPGVAVQQMSTPPATPVWSDPGWGGTDPSVTFFNGPPPSAFAAPPSGC